MATTWSIVDGNLPYLNDFPTQYAVEYISDGLWQIDNGELPYRISFPQLKAINGAPLSAWRVDDGCLPYLAAFPERARFTDVPLGIWAIRNGELPYLRNFPQMPGPPRMWGSPTKLLLEEMHKSPILLKTQKSQDVQIGDTTIPHQITKRLFDGIDWELI